MRKSSELNRHGGTFVMPGNFRVKVVILDKDEAEVEMDADNLAEYYREDHRIQLRKSRTLKQRKTDLEHELQHCCVDWVDHFMRRAKSHGKS